MPAVTSPVLRGSDGWANQKPDKLDMPIEMIQNEMATPQSPKD